MKSNLFSFGVLLFALFSFPVLSFAQPPQLISYQAVVRNAGDQLIVNSPIGMRVSFVYGSPFGASVFVEQHTPVSNENG